jgi:hypothetical protein
MRGRIKTFQINTDHPSGNRTYSVFTDGDRSKVAEDSLGLSSRRGSKELFLPSGLVKKYQTPVFLLRQASPETCFPLSLTPAFKIR